MPDHPSLAEQIEAVEWAECYAQHIADWAVASRGIADSIAAQIRRRLEAAAETLRTLEFGAEIAS